MMVLRRSEMTYYIRDHVVTIQHHQQFTAFTDYSLGKNKKRFNDFVLELSTSRSPKFSNWDSLFKLASKYRLTGVRGFDPRPQLTFRGTEKC